MPKPSPVPLKVMQPVLRPTQAEALAMLHDLRQTLKSDSMTALLLRVQVAELNKWGVCAALSPRIAGIIWDKWCQICRPGQVRTVFDLATFGRFTASGGPQHAGKAPLRPLTRRVKTTDVVDT